MQALRPHFPCFSRTEDAYSHLQKKRIKLLWRRSSKGIRKGKRGKGRVEEGIGRACKKSIMKKTARNRKKIKAIGLLSKSIGYSLHKNPVEFYISEATASYGNKGKKPFTVYYDNPEHSVRLLKGDCIEILNQVRENSVDMIFADPPYFLSNGGITCHAGK